MFSSSSLNPSSFEVSLQETIWVDTITFLSKNPKGKYSLRMIGVMCFWTKRSSICTIACFLSTFFFSFFFKCWWVFHSCCRILGRLGYECNTCFLRGLFRVTNVQPYSSYDIDLVSKQRRRRLCWHDTCVCFGFGDSHWIILAHAPSFLKWNM